VNRYRKPLALRPQPEAAPPAPSRSAAGLGKRMRPLTATRPKPLVEVAGKPLLDHALDRLRAAGVKRAVVNVHYLADALEAHVRKKVQDLEITISDERELLLETGGGLVKALPLIDADPFLVVNSDNLWVDGAADSIRALAARWDDAAMDALLLLVPLARANCHNGKGDFHMDGAGRLSRRKPGRLAPFVFTGVQILSKRLFDGAKAEPFSLNVLWDRAIEKGRAFGLAHNGLWFDVGTPPAVKKTEEILRQE
jgi:N-acetyl-alpha-D-muramate 1-phosphate uridylyltransferase